MTRILTRHGITAIALALLSTLAIAETTAADVAKAIDQGQFHKADVLLHDVIQKHPRNARAHFILAQVLDHEGRPADGLTELNAARSLDPRASYASPARVKAVEDRLVADERQQQPVAQATAPLPSAMMTASVPMQPVAAPASRAIETKVWVGIGLTVVLLILFGLWMGRRARRKREEAATNDRQNQLRSLTNLLSTAKSAKLDALLTSDDAGKDIASDATELSAQITEALERVQSGRLLPASDLQALDHRTQIVRARSLGKPTPSLSGSEDPGYVPRAPSVAYEPSYARGYSQPPVIAAPSTVIVNQSSNDGFLTGMLVGEAFREPRTVERDVIVEHDRESAGRYDGPADRDASRDRASDRDDVSDRNAGANVDVGNGGSGWDDSSANVDTGDDGGSGGSWDADS